MVLIAIWPDQFLSFESPQSKGFTRTKTNVKPYFRLITSTEPRLKVSP